MLPLCWMPQAVEKFPLNFKSAGISGAFLI